MSRGLGLCSRPTCRGATGVASLVLRHTQIAYDSVVEFIETPAFTARLAEYLADDEYRELQAFLAEDPQAGNVIQGTGGFRKLRWTDSVRGKGKRGGLRVIYYYLLSDTQIWLMTLYNKGEMSDLNAAEKRALKSALEAELARRAVRRAHRRT